MRTKFKPGDMVRMNKEWAVSIEKLLGEPPSKEEMEKIGMVYKVGDEYDICFGVGVKWNDDGCYTNVNPDALEII
jgi:hypothetical protein